MIRRKFIGLVLSILGIKATSSMQTEYSEVGILVNGEKFGPVKTLTFDMLDEAIKTVEDSSPNYIIIRNGQLIRVKDKGK